MFDWRMVQVQESGHLGIVEQEQTLETLTLSKPLPTVLGTPKCSSGNWLRVWSDSLAFNSDAEIFG